MKDFKKLIKESHLGNPLNEVDRATQADLYLSGEEEYPEFDPRDVLDDLENEDKLPDGFHSKEDLDQFIKDNPFDSERYRKLSIAQKQDILSYLNRDTEKEFERRMAMREGKIDRVVGHSRYKYVGDGRKGQAIVSGPMKDREKEAIIKRAKEAGYIAKPNMGGGVTIQVESLNEEFSPTEQKMIKQIISYKKRGSDMINLPFKPREFYFKNTKEIDALIEKEKWPKTLPSRYSDEYRFELEKVTPTYQDKPGRAKYRVIDIESGELKGTPVFGTPESLMAYADDLIKKQGGTQSTNLGEDINDPVLMRTRAAQMKRDAIEKKDLENKSKRISAEKAIDLRYELDILSKERENILMRIEDLGFETDQTAEPEGGKKADDVGRRMEIAIKDLRDINSKITDIKDDLGIFDMNESDLDEGTCGYGEDGVIKDKPAGPDLNKESFDLDIDDAHSGDAALDRTIGKMYNESLRKSLKESLNKRLGK